MVIKFENDFFPMYKIHITNDKFESEYGEIKVKRGKSINDVRNKIIESLERTEYVDLTNLCEIKINEIQNKITGEYKK
jgi:hypothetical protein